MENNIEKLENLPKRGPMKNKYHDKWPYSNGRGVYRKIDNVYPWTHVKRILNKYRGKNVDAAFSEYCKKVDKCQQYMFWDELNDDKRNRRMFGNRFSYWYIDNNKCIQRFKAKRNKKQYKVESHNIRYGYYNIHTGMEVRTPRWYDIDNPNIKYGAVEGEVFYFDSKDAAYEKCYAEQESKRRKYDRLDKIEKSKKEYSFLTREEIEQIEDRANDKIKLESHGFDGESFTNKNNRLK